MLSKASGETITPAMIERDIAEGAPIDRDGRMNLIHYTAWVLRRRRDDGVA